MSLKALLCLKWAFLVFLPVQLFAATLYVDGVDGVDDPVRTGTNLQDAFETIEFASARALAGDTVIVMPGYYSKIDWKDGVTYRAHGRAVITQHALATNHHQGTVIDGFEFQVGATAFTKGINLTIKNSSFLGGTGFNGPNIRDTRVEKCLFLDVRSGFATGEFRNIIDRCTFVGTSGTAVVFGGDLNRVINSVFYGNTQGILAGGPTSLNSVEFSAFYNNETDFVGPLSVSDNNNFIEAPRLPGGSNKPPVDPNFLDPAKGLYFLKSVSVDGTSPNPLVNGGSFLPQENRVVHIGAFGVGVLSDRNPIVPEPGPNDFIHWEVADGEPDSGIFIPVIDPSAPVEFDAENNLRLKSGIIVATLRSNVIDLGAVPALSGFEVVAVHYSSIEDQETLPAGLRRVIDHNTVDDGSGDVLPNRRRTIRFRGSVLSPTDLLAQSFVEINNMQRLGNIDFRYVQLEIVLRQDGH